MEGFYWRSLVFLEILQQCLFPTVWWQHSKTSKLGVPWTRFSLHRLYLCYTLQLGWILMVERTMQFHCPFWMINSVCIYIYMCVCWISIIEVWKSTTWGAHLTAKAYNARVVVSWLASCLEMAVERRVEEGRLMGQCLAGLEWPQHELLIPSAVAMTPSQNE